MGKITIGENLESGEIPRQDVANVIAEVLEMPELSEKEFDLLSGSTPITNALETFLT